MLKFKFTRYWQCDLCGKTVGNTDSTFLPERGQMPPERAFPDSWHRFNGIHGKSGIQICDKHEILVDGKRVGELEEIIHKNSQQEYEDKFWERKDERK